MKASRRGMFSHPSHVVRLRRGIEPNAYDQEIVTGITVLERGIVHPHSVHCAAKLLDAESMRGHSGPPTPKIAAHHGAAARPLQCRISIRPCRLGVKG
jgi:hypothetical protein